MRENNWIGASVDLGGLIADGFAVTLPGIPGGAGLAIKASREASGFAAASATKPEAYSVFFETTIAKTGSGSRTVHKVLANKELNSAMANKETKEMLSSLGVAPVKGNATPNGFRWHHSAERKGVMQLVPEGQHKSGSAFQDALHPGGKG